MQERPGVSHHPGCLLSFRCHTVPTGIASFYPLLSQKCWNCRGWGWGLRYHPQCLIHPPLCRTWVPGPVGARGTTFGDSEHRGRCSPLLPAQWQQSQCHMVADSSDQPLVAPCVLGSRPGCPGRVDYLEGEQEPWGHIPVPSGR
jgi:hypothetical protein